MQKRLEQAQTQIEQALLQCRKPIPPHIVDAFPLINEWIAIADHDVPHIHGVASYPMQAQRPILTAAIIGIDMMPGLVIRCLDGNYRLGQPAHIDDKVKSAGEDSHKGRIDWPRFQDLVETFCLKLSDADHGIY